MASSRPLQGGSIVAAAEGVWGDCRVGVRESQRTRLFVSRATGSGQSGWVGTCRGCPEFRVIWR